MINFKVLSRPEFDLYLERLTTNDAKAAGSIVGGVIAIFLFLLVMLILCVTGVFKKMAERIKQKYKKEKEIK